MNGYHCSTSEFRLHRKRKTKRPIYVPPSPSEKLPGEEDDVPLFVHVLPSIIVLYVLFFIPWMFFISGELLFEINRCPYVADLVLPSAQHINDDYPDECLQVVNIERLGQRIQIDQDYLKTPQETVERLEQEKKKASDQFPHSELTLCIRCDENMPCVIVKELLDCAKAAGISHVIFGVRDRSRVHAAHRQEKNNLGWFFGGNYRIRESGFKLDLMTVSPSSENPIELGITEDGEILLGSDIIGAPDDVSLENLVRMLKSAAEKDKNQPIVIRCNRGVAYHRFIDVLDVCAAAGIKNISLEISPRNELERK